MGSEEKNRVVNGCGKKAPAESWCRILLENVEGQTLDGTIPLLLPRGQYKHPDVTKVATVDGGWIHDWIKESGLPQHGDTEEERAQFARDMATMSTYFLPSIDSSSDQMKIFMWIMTLSFLGDDELEGRDLFGRDKVIGQEMAGVVGDIFRGKFKTFESIPVPEEAFGIKALIKAGFIAAQKANVHLPHFFRDSGHLAEAISLAYSGMLAMELEDHYEEDMGDLPVDTYGFFRRYEGGFEGLIEAALLCSGAVPTPAMRRNLLFRRILELAWSINVNVNDLFSVRKELESGVGYNLVVYKSRFMELPVAFAQVVQTVGEQVVNMKALSERYRSISTAEPMVERVLEVLEQMVDGHIHWYTTNKRYGDLKLEFT